MLDVAQDRGVEGDMCLHDLGQGLPLRPGTFDGAISISAVQWLCNAVRAALPNASSSTIASFGNQCRLNPRPDRTQPCRACLSFKCPVRLLLQHSDCRWHQWPAVSEPLSFRQHTYCLLEHGHVDSLQLLEVPWPGIAAM